MTCFVYVLQTIQKTICSKYNTGTKFAVYWYPESIKQKGARAEIRSVWAPSNIGVTALTTAQILSARSRRSRTSPFPSALPCSKPRTLPERFCPHGSMRSGACTRGDKFSAVRPARGFADTAALHRLPCRCARGCRTRGYNTLCCHEP